MLPIAILSGGYATRLGSLTKGFPKCLIDINGRPFIDWQLDLLVEGGYLDFVFCVSYKSEMVQDHLGDGSRWGAKFQYSIDGELQLGTGGAIRKALPLLGKSFGVIYGDSYLPITYSAVEQAFLNSEKLALMTVYKNENRFDASNVEFSNENLLAYEKGVDNKRMQHIDYGLSYFKEEAFTNLIYQSPFDLSSLCQQLAISGHIGGFEAFARFYEIGSVKGISEFSQFIRKVAR